VQRYGAAYATIHRADLHGLLHTGVQRYTDAQLYQGLAIESFTDASRAAPVIPGARRWCRCAPRRAKRLRAMHSLAPMACGAARTQLLGPGPRVTGHLAYRALVRQSALPEGAQHVTAWLGPRLHMVQYPVRRGELQNLVVIVQGPAPQNLETWDHAPTRATWNLRCRAPAPRCNTPCMA
jgi:salicylate hydroxylase